MNKYLALFCLTIVALIGLCCTPAATAQEWKSVIEQRLPEYGHRNWIVIADAAYPSQSAAGIETVATGAGQLEVLQYVLKEIDAAPHVRPVVMIDAELKDVPDENAAGVQAYREKLNQIFGDRSIKVMPHDDIIGKLDEGSRLFKVLILKTKMTIPYTSVFIELDCGYWDAKFEQQLRAAMERSQQASE